MIKYLNSLLEKNGSGFKEYQDKIKDFLEKKKKAKEERKSRFGDIPLYVIKKIDENPDEKPNENPLANGNQKPSDNNSKGNEKKEKNTDDKKKILDKYSKLSSSSFWRKDSNN